MNIDFNVIDALLLLVIAIGVCVLLLERRSSMLRLKNREEWVRSYLKHYPHAPPLQIIGAYNSHRELGEQWGYFSLREMECLIAKIKREGLP
jgi:hypothetical protein